MEPEDQLQAVATAEGASTSEGPAPDQDKGPSRGQKPGDQEPHEEEPWRRRLWFVRQPRPPEAGATKGMEQELETLRTQHNLITEALNVKKMERDNARESTRAARDAFTQCRAAYDERAAPLKKLREQGQDAAATANKLKASFNDLLVKSEAELDAKLAELHYRIEHESISLGEEKAAMATIKKLEAQRERVREYESSASLFAESRAKRAELAESLKEHEGELSALRQEMDLQRQILDKLREAERRVDGEVEEVLGERRRCKELMDAAFHRLNAQKKAQWEKNNAFYTNRAFSREVRKLLADGKLEEARDACAAQADEGVAALAANPALRGEYFALWEQQRKAPVTLPAVDDAEGSQPAAAKGGRGGRKKAAEEAVDPAKKAEAAIAALLEEAREEARRAKAAAAAEQHHAAAASAVAAASAAAAAVERAAAEGAADAEPAAPASPPEVVGAPDLVRREAPKAHKAAAARPAAAAAAVVEPVVEPPEDFELPEAIRNKSPSSQDLTKEQERERNRAAQAEAERRKAKKASDKERKRRRQEQLAREAVAAAARAAEDAAAAQVAAAAATAAQLAPDAQALPAADASTASSDGARSPPPELAAAAAAAPAAAAAAEPRKKGSGGGKGHAAPLPVVKAMAPKPAARRPAGSKQGGLVKQAKRLGKDYSLALTAGLVALLALAVAALSWTAAAVAPQ